MIACLGTIIFQCNPIRAAFDFSLRGPPFGKGTGTCYSMKAYKGIALFNSGMCLPLILTVGNADLDSYQHHHGCSLRNPADSLDCQAPGEYQNQGVARDDP